MPLENLFKELEGAVRWLSRDHLTSVAKSLEKAEDPDDIQWHTLSRLTLPNAQKHAVENLVSAWRVNSDLTGRDIAVALRTLAQAEEGYDEWRPELVWTGPKSDDVNLRQTEAALNELIRAAEDQLILVSYVVFKHAPLLEELKRAVSRGVTIRFIGDSEDDYNYGKDATRVFEELGEDNWEYYVWPADQKPSVGSHGTKKPALHAKCAIADDKLLFVSSANLTEFALNFNMELGVLVRDRSAVETASRHISSLLENEVFLPSREV